MLTGSQGTISTCSLTETGVPFEFGLLEIRLRRPPQIRRQEARAHLHHLRAVACLGDFRRKSKNLQALKCQENQSAARDHPFPVDFSEDFLARIPPAKDMNNSQL